VLDRWRLPVGTLLMAVPALVHRRADLYPDPGAFRPERFLGVRPRTYEWIPFGGGVRRCLGAPLAELEMRRLIGAVVRARTLQSAAGRSERAALSGTALVPSRWRPDPGALTRGATGRQADAAGLTSTPRRKATWSLMWAAAGKGPA
jgi:cytochrome P450